MDGLRNPVGEEPPEVYWRRRIVVVASALLLIIVLWYLITSPSGETPSTAEPTPTTSTTPVPSTSPAANANASRACTDADVEITTTPNPRDFGAGSLPVFDVTIEHVGFSPCLLDTASEGTELLITSGSDRIWSSTDCPDDPTINARQFVLQAEASETFQVTWSRQRSNPDCTTVTAEPRPGTYKAELTIQGIGSEIATFTLSE